MVLFCRRHLFSKFCIEDGYNYLTLTKLLATDADIPRYIKKFLYRFSAVNDNERILELLGTKTSSLRSIVLGGFYGSFKIWNELLITIQMLLVPIQLPTITHLDLRYLNNLPIVELSRCSHQDELRLEYVTGATFHQSQIVDQNLGSGVFG
ncbi:hypothetical protein CVT25_006953 [Psilocybe cyanescens]|uniref:F-box domain-containing protein n=1 Tax=Psilocybe cyanescens TaxID=93625 RepID=A0A409VSR8_PSICY|nr:hypothetical protein CVT25_006953 [Psilocybe cyanescens]